MALVNDMPFSSIISFEDRDLLAVSGLLDEANYRVWAGISDDTDAVAHYLEKGWLHGINPREGFDGEFLRPYYEAAGRHGAPALTWLELSAMPGRRPPKNYSEAAWLADKIRPSPYFDADSYGKRLDGNLDPALHYAIIGESLGWLPSQEFDPVFYLECNPDVVEHSISPLCHYIDYGYREGRSGVPAALKLAFHPVADRQRPTILIFIHEATRTGAPILGWNIARWLAKSYNVVSILMRGGELEEHFVAVSAATVGPIPLKHWHPTEMKYIAERLSSTYNPLYAIANSIETHSLVPPLAKLGIPSVALMHEFASYVRPLERVRDMLDWATHIVFPAHLVAQSAFSNFPGFANRRGLHVLPQGRSDLPEPREGSHPPGEQIDRIEPKNLIRTTKPSVALGASHDAFVVLGLGSVRVRKGVDIFLATAASARRLAPNVRFRFIWIGDGYDPVRDGAYSIYLAEQLIRSDLCETVSILGAVDDLDPIYAGADVFFMCSRLDPQPNVGIDALTRGLPTVCFENACGTAEILYADPETRPLVVPYLDAHAAAEVICRFASDGEALAAVAKATARVGQAAYNMKTYIDQVDRWGTEAAAALHPEDLRTLADARIVDSELALPPSVVAPGAFGVEKHVLQQWAVVGISKDQISNTHFRRPCAGFHPQIYAEAHNDACGESGANPLAHWLRCGRPKGRWLRQVFSPLDGATREVASTTRVALHAHFYHELGARDLAARLFTNKTECDLFLSTDTEVKAEHLRSAFANHRGGIDIRIMPNRGRDIAPFLTGLAREISDGGYDVFGHVHGKRSLDLYATLGNLWREFLWENLVGGAYPMLDLAVSAITSQPDIGLLIAEDPHLVGWNGNRAIAERLAKRMGIVTPLEDFFDFPLGTMFWARPGALQPLVALHLEWEDYPVEPVPNDGNILHALERLLPYATTHAGFRIAGLRAPGTTW